MVGGSEGVGQRGLKQEYRNATRAQAGSSFGYAPVPMTGGQGMGGMMGMMGGRGMASAPAAAKFKAGGARDASAGPDAFGRPGAAPARAEAEDNTNSTVRQVGSKTFFRKGNRWVDSSVTPEQEAKAVVLSRFSERYFKLARSQDATSISTSPLRSR